MLLSSLIGNSINCLLDSADSSDSASISPNKTSRIRKRKLEEVTAEITPVEKLVFIPLSMNKRAPQLNLPPDLDMTSAYSLFSLFIPEEIFEKIVNSTNVYTHLKREIDDEFIKFKDQPWKNTNAAEIKVFFATLIYMGIHDSGHIDNYWRKKLE